MGADQLYLSERYFLSDVNQATCCNSNARFDVMVFPMMDTSTLQPVMAGTMLNWRSGGAGYLEARSVLSCAGRESWV